MMDIVEELKIRYRMYRETDQLMKKATDVIVALRERLAEVEQTWAKDRNTDRLEIIRLRQIYHKDIRALNEKVADSDAALQKISIALGGTDEWSDRATMIGYVVRLVRQRAACRPGCDALTHIDRAIYEIDGKWYSADEMEKDAGKWK